MLLFTKCQYPNFDRHVLQHVSILKGARLCVESLTRVNYMTNGFKLCIIIEDYKKLKTPISKNIITIIN